MSSSVQAPASNKKEDKSSVVRTLAGKASNKWCFNCLKTGTQRSVDMTHGTFICAECAGRQRGVAGSIARTISASTFTEKEAAIFEKMGNKRARKIWYHGLDDDKLKALIADCGDNPDKWSKHLHAVFVEKRWYKPQNANESSKTVAPSSTGGTAVPVPSTNGHSPSVNSPPDSGNAVSAAPQSNGHTPSTAMPSTAPPTATRAVSKSVTASTPPVDSLLDAKTLAAVEPEPIRPEKKGQSKALPLNNNEADDFNPFDGPQTAPPNMAPSSPAPSSSGASSALVMTGTPAAATSTPATTAEGLASPIPANVILRAIRDSLSTVQQRGKLTHSQLRSFVMQALDGLASGPSLPASPSTQPGMPSPAPSSTVNSTPIAVPTSAVTTTTPAAAPVATTTAANGPVKLDRLPSLSSIVPLSDWSKVTTTPATATASPAAPTASPFTPQPSVPSTVAASSSNNPFAFGDDDSNGASAADNPFAFGADTTFPTPTTAAAAATSAPAKTPFDFDSGLGAPTAVNAPLATPFDVSAVAVAARRNSGSAMVGVPFGMPATTAATAVPTVAMTSPFAIPTAATPTTVPAAAMTAAMPALTPQLMALLASNPALLTQFMAAAAAAAGTSAVPTAVPTGVAVPLSATAVPAPFIASGPLAGIQPLAVKKAANDVMIPAAPPKPDPLATLNPLK